jgi:OOP family OmpA-OmpF porin
MTLSPPSIAARHRAVQRVRDTAFQQTDSKEQELIIKYQHAIARMTAVAALAAGTALTADAQESANSSYVTILPHYVNVDDDRRGTDDDGQGLAIGYGRQIGDRWAWELQPFTDSFGTQPEAFSDFSRNGVGFDFKYAFRSGDGFAPFVLLGGGVARNEVIPSTLNDNDYFANAGLGFVTGELGDSGVRVRAEVRYVRDRYEIGNEGHKNERRIALGVQIPLGRKPTERIVEREVVREVTRDVPANIVDSDNDGVPDQVDRCPGTLAGLATDNRGCAATAEQSSVRLDGVSFEFNSAELTARARETLRGVVEALRGEPGLRAEIAGHTDASGPDEYNQRLSQQRSESVQQYLVSQGIDRNRLVARGYGESRPVADNSTDAGRERNRRVEFNVLR